MYFQYCIVVTTVLYLARSTSNSPQGTVLENYLTNLGCVTVSDVQGVQVQSEQYKASTLECVTMCTSSTCLGVLIMPFSSDSGVQCIPLTSANTAVFRLPLSQCVNGVAGSSYALWLAKGATCNKPCSPLTVWELTYCLHMDPTLPKLMYEQANNACKSKGWEIPQADDVTDLKDIRNFAFYNGIGPEHVWMGAAYDGAAGFIWNYNGQTLSPNSPMWNLPQEPEDPPNQPLVALEDRRIVDTWTSSQFSVVCAERCVV